MQALARNGYTADEVKAALHAARSARHLSFKYQLLNSSMVHKSWISDYVLKDGNRISNNALADIKRTAQFNVSDSVPGINWLSDRIKPYILLKMADGGFTEWPQGIFLLSSPTRTIDESGHIYRSVEAYDQAIILRDDKVTDRYTVAAGTNYITALKALLDGSNIMLQNLEPTTKTLPTALDWPPGTSKLEIANDLLSSINYRPLWFDEEGYARAQAYVSPAAAAIEYTYRNDQESVIFPEASETLELFDVHNKWTIVVSEPDRAVLTSTYTNSNPDSPTSTVSRGRTITDFREENEAADQPTLDAKVARIAFEASQAYGIFEFQTAIMPMHSQADVLQLEYTDLGLAYKYAEHMWEYELKSATQMKHTVRRVVSV